MTSPRWQQRPLRRRAIWSGLGFVVSLFFLVGWFDEGNEVETRSAGLSDILLVNDAGPVQVVMSPTDEVVITRRNSWLFSEPAFETSARDARLVARATCPGRFPCRTSVTLAVPEGVSVVVVANGGLVDVEQFDGDLSVFSDGGGVLLGPVVGSARVLSRDGDVRGLDLQAAELEVEAENADVDLSFEESPRSVIIRGDSGAVSLALPKNRYRIDAATSSSSAKISVDFDSVESSGRFVVVRSAGPVAITEILG